MMLTDTPPVRCRKQEAAGDIIYGPHFTEILSRPIHQISQEEKLFPGSWKMKSWETIASFFFFIDMDLFLHCDILKKQKLSAV